MPLPVDRESSKAIEGLAEGDERLPSPEPQNEETPKSEQTESTAENEQTRDFIVEAEEEMQRKGPSPWHGLELDDYDDWA